jgi:serine/threonine-protein kinase
VLQIDLPRCFLRDLESTNGTFVNGQKVREAWLHHGDVISGGHTRIQVAVLGAGEAITTGPPTAPTQGASPAVPPLPAPVRAGLEDTARWPAIPGYQLLGKLGQGGRGAVYLAERPATGDRVALKAIVPESAASDQAMRRFLREINVLSQLDHPRIVRFLEMDMIQGQFYFAMEFVPTLSIVERLAKAAEADRIKVYCGLICQLLEALAHAHTRFFVHRDVKPGNLLIRQEGNDVGLKLADFGLAKNFQTAGFSGITGQGTAIGTWAFMAPEQLLDARQAEPAVDIYAAGAALYYFLAGDYPCSFANKDPFLVVLEDEPRPLRQLRLAVPQRLADIV